MKKYLPYIFIIAAITTAITLPHGAMAQNEEASGGGLWSFFNIGEIFLHLLALIGNAVLSACSWVLRAAAALFNMAIEKSLTNDFGVVDAASSFVEEGWRLARDLVNMFFIFIVVFIGIATILNIQRYDVRRLLLRVIIIALLVNFSLFAAQTIIKASNALALEFYDKISGDLAGSFADGLKIQTVYPGAEEPFGVVGQPKATASEIILKTLFGSVLILIASFVLFAGAILFIIRSVALMLLMITAPFAFVAMALPMTGSYAKDWWNKLFKHSFFAPIYIFQFYLIAKLIQNGALTNALDTGAGVGYSNIFTGGEGANYSLILQFVVLVIMMMGILATAKMLGASGAQTMTKWGEKGKDWTLGYAGKLPGRLARRGLGKPAEAFATGEAEKGAGRITRAAVTAGKGVRKIPLVGKWTTRGAADIAAANRKRIKELQEKYKHYSATELKNMVPDLGGFERAAILQRLTEMKNLKPEGKLTKRHIESGKQLMENYGMGTWDMKKLRWQYLEPDEYLKDLKPDEVKNILIRGREQAGGFIDALKKMGGTIEEISNKFRTEEYGNNIAMAEWLYSTPAKSVMRLAGVKTEGKESGMKSPLITKNISEEFRTARKTSPVYAGRTPTTKTDSLTNALNEPGLREVLKTAGPYDAQKGTAAVAEAFKRLYAEKEELTERMNSLTNEYRTTINRLAKEQPAKPANERQNTASQQIFQRLRREEKTAINDYMETHGEKISGTGRKPTNAEVPFSDFMKYVDRNTKK